MGSLHNSFRQVPGAKVLTYKPHSKHARPTGPQVQKLEPARLSAAIKAAARAPKNKVRIGTLSFESNDGPVLPNRGALITDIVHQRRADLLLVAGSSIDFRGELAAIVDATTQTETIVVLEVYDTGINYRVERGQPISMGRQFLATRYGLMPEVKKEKLASLSDAVEKNRRTFFLQGRPVCLLICGEINTLIGREGTVRIPRDVPDELQSALEMPDTIFLNPTHTLMGRQFILDAKRKFLSDKKRTYVSASNWTPKHGSAQKLVAPLQTVWDNGDELDIYNQLGSEDEGFCYREWHIPRR